MKISTKALSVLQLLYSFSLLLISIFVVNRISPGQLILHPDLIWQEGRFFIGHVILAVSLLGCFIFTFPIFHGLQPGVHIPLIPTWVPWLGYAIQYSFNGQAFMISCRRKYGSVFKFQAGGKFIIALSQPAAIVDVLRSKKFGVVEFQMLQHLSGIKDRSRMPLVFSVGHLKAISTAAAGLSPRNLRPVATIFNARLYELLKEVVPRGDVSEVSLGVTDFVRRNLFMATSIAFMGPHFPADIVYQDFVAFDEGVVSLVRRLPFGKGKAEAARERQVKNLTEFFKRYWREEEGGYIEGAAESFMSNVMRSMKASVLTDEELCRLQATFVWGTHANQGQVCTWLFHHLLTDQIMFSRIKEEIRCSLTEHFSDIAKLLYADPRDLEENTFPLLTSAIQECLRLTSLNTSARQALVDVDITAENGHPMRVRKGEIVLADVLNMHTDPEHFEDPFTFKFDRFVPNRDGNNTREKNKAFLPFGSGLHMCAGRYYAMHAIRMFVILCFHFYDVSPSPGGNGQLPQVDPTSFISIVRTSEDRPIILKRRLL